MWRLDLRLNRLGLSQGVYGHFQKNQNLRGLLILHNLQAEFEYLHNSNYVSGFLDIFTVCWWLFGLIWSRSEEVIIETNFIISQIGLIFT